jgi:hypothetical protein
MGQVRICDGNIHMRGFDDIARVVGSSMSELEVDSPEIHNLEVWFGAHTSVITGQYVPERAIVYNLEQWGSPQMSEAYIDLLRRHTVWDCFLRNVVRMRHLGIDAHFVPIGYSPRWIIQDTDLPGYLDDWPIDILHVGCVSERRGALLRKIHQISRGTLNVRCCTETYGNRRDKAILEAKVCLNIHYYGESDMEETRMGHMVANRKLVLTEEATCETPLLNAWVAHNYEYCHLAESAVAWATTDACLVREAARRDHRKFMKTNMTDNISRALNEARNERGTA